MITGIVFRVSILLVNLALGTLAFRRSRRSATNVILLLLTIAIFGWGVANEFSVNASTQAETLFWTRAVMACAVPVSLLFFMLMYVFPRATLQLTKTQIGGVLLLGILGVGTAASPFLFTGLSEGVGRFAKPIPGPGLPVFIAIAVVPIILGLAALIRKNWTLTGVARLQARYLLVGAGVMYLFIFGLILLPVLLHTASLVAYAPLFTLPFIGTTTYAIIKYRLMDIRLALLRGLSLTFLVAAVLGIYGVMVLFAVPVIADVTEISGNILAAGAALISIPVAQYVRKILTKLTDKFLFQNRADYGKALLKIGKELSGTIDIAEVSDTVLQVMHDFVRARKAIILLWDEESLEFVPDAGFGAGNFEITIPAAHPLVSDLRNHQGVLVKDEERIAAEIELNPIRQKQEKAVLDSFDWLDMAAVVPLFVNKELTGIILLGEKISGDPFLQSDADFLNALAPQAATALENARLYKQSLEFGERLKKEVQRATHELETANVQLKNLDKAKSEFLSIASHQLYTPLTALRGYVSMLAEGDFGKVPDKQKEVLNILEKSATRLIDLIKNLLDISRIESGRLELNLESADMVEMGKELVADLMPNAMNKNLKLEFHEPRTPIHTVVVDRQRIRQVMLNLIDNAIKYTEKGRVDVRVWQVGEFVTFTVKDTGKGIKRDELARLFNKFSRVGGSARFHTEGTGLGLYVARQIVKEHHGEVQVDSPGEGQGSTFSMQLPAEGTAQSLKPGEKAEVVIKAAEAAPA